MRELLSNLIIKDDRKMILLRVLICFVIFAVSVVLSCHMGKVDSDVNGIWSFPLADDYNYKVIFIVLLMLFILFLTRKALYYFYEGFDGINKSELEKIIDPDSAAKITKCIEFVKSYITIFCVILFSVLFTFIIFNTWNETIQQIIYEKNYVIKALIYPYSVFLSAFVISGAFYGYVCLVVVIWITKIFRNCEFQEYTKRIPVATPVIQILFRILNKGLCLFLAIGFSLLVLAQLARFGELKGNTFIKNMDMVSIIIISIFIVGYIVFTYFPYYYLHKTIGKLKDRDIKELYDDAEKNNKLFSNEYISAVASVYATPTLNVSNVLNVLLSTILAITQIMLLFH